MFAERYPLERLRPLRSAAGLSGWMGSLFVSRAASILIADGRTDNATHRWPVGTLWQSNQKYGLFFRRRWPVARGSREIYNRETVTCEYLGYSFGIQLSLIDCHRA